MMEKIQRRYFKIIYADPPWNYQTWSHRGEGKGASQHYTCMGIPEICAMPVKEIADDNAVLFMWVVQPMLPEALQVMESWGFKYRTVAFYWVKMRKGWDGSFLHERPRMGLGYHTRSGAEQCWLGVRGKGYKRQKQSVEQVIFASLREHSQKPDEAIERIEQLVGDIPRIELFARSKRAGWEAWGNEV